MKHAVKKFTHVLVTALTVALLSSCAQEEKTAVQPASSISDQRMTALVDLFYADYTEAGMQKFQSSYEKLSLEELLAFRKLQLSRQADQAKGARMSAEMMAQDAEKYTGIYKQALSETGVAINRMTPEQQDAFFTNREKSEAAASNARTEQAQGTCPIVNFNVVNGVGYGDILGKDWSFVRLVDPGGKNDCDCEIGFASSRKYGQVLSPKTLEHRALALAFNDRIGGNHYISNPTYISTAVFGQTRMYYVYGRVDCAYLGFKMNDIRETSI